MKVLVLTPFKFEQKKLFPHAIETVSGDFPVPVIKLTDSIFLATTGQGKAQCAAITTLLIERLKIDKALLIGSAGALNKSLNTNSLCVVKSVVEWDFKSFNGQDQNKLPEFHYDIAFTSQLYQQIVDNGGEVEYGTLASGDSDIFSDTARDSLYNATTCSIVAWESAGFIRATQILKIPSAEIRIPVDFGPVADFNEFQNLLKTKFSLFNESIENSIRGLF